nr:MAG TPA_asm: hypothetical protein [Caudoviricetes sp.]
MNSSKHFEGRVWTRGGYKVREVGRRIKLGS